MLNRLIKCQNITRLCKISIREMKYLNVAEKNEAAKTIASLLSKGNAARREGYSVYNKIYEFKSLVNGRECQMVMTSVSGHLLETEFLPAYRNWRNVNPVTLFDAPIRKTCKEEFQPIKRTLEREVRGCQGLIIWTDCDREGENIGMEIVDVCRAINARLTVHRAVFSEITTASVKRALQQLKTLDKRASDAVDVRSELDLRSGAAITRFQTMRLQRLFPQNVADKLISYGSCQIPTLGFVAERYKEIEAFVSEPFWKIKVLHTIGDLSVEFNWARHRLFNKSECENYYILCVADPTATVENVTIKSKNKWRPQPMDTVELEKLASRKLKLPAKETMTIAEKLYTKGCISYPRTETNQFSKEINLRNLVEQQVEHPTWGQFAKQVIEWGPNPRNGNKSDQAHPPIHPTKLITNLNGNEARVYELICRHFLACASKDAVGMETVVNIDIAGEKFNATGLCIYERNYLDVYIYDKWNAKQIHKYTQGEKFEPTDISMAEGATTAPPLLTEADLIALMEKHGIGTDATHAEHINTIKERGYIGVIDKGFLVPGVIGMALYEGYNEIQLALAKPIQRAEFEEDLKKICLGEKDPKIVLSEQIVKYKEAYKQIMDHITEMDNKIATRFAETPAYDRNESSGNHTETNIEPLQELFQCPKCKQAPLGLKKKKNVEGHFIGCLNFPNCKNVVWWPDECKEPHVLDEFCQKCGVKLIKFKFQNHVHKTKFNAPHGWYKTCLHCDAHFRNTFEINLENIKSIGSIVGNVTSSSTSASSTTNSTSNQNPNTKRNDKKKSTTVNNGNLRRHFSTSGSSVVSEEAIISQQLNSAVLDEFFSSNDSFEIHARNIENNTRDVNHIEETNLLLDNWDDNDFDLVETANTHRTTTNIPVSTTNQNINRENDNFRNEGILNDLNSSWGSNGISNSLRRNDVSDNHTKCSGCHQKAIKSFVTKEGPNKGRAYYKCPKIPPCKFFQWEDEDKTTSVVNAMQSSSNTKVDCRCGKAAKSLVVQKEGPNKGRDFFACANRDKSCGFFQWKDDLNQGGNSSSVLPSCSSSNDNWGTGNRDANVRPNVKRKETTTARVPQKRKCGLCRQEGHTRAKCPRVGDFNF